MLLFTTFTSNVLSKETGAEKELKKGFVPVDLIEVYQIDLKSNPQKESKTSENEPKVLFFDVDIMKLKLNYDFENTESALKNIRPK